MAVAKKVEYLQWPECTALPVYQTNAGVRHTVSCVCLDSAILKQETKWQLVGKKNWVKLFF